MSKGHIFVLGIIIGVFVTFYEFASGNITIVSEHIRCERVNK